MSGCTSPLSNDISTIFCRQILDTCNKKIILSWNSYPSQPKIVTGYSLMQSVNGGSYYRGGSAASRHYRIYIDDFITDATYCFFVRANLEDGSISTSNKTCVETRMQDHLTGSTLTMQQSAENRDLAFLTIDPVSEIVHFLLERKTGKTGLFVPLAQLGPDDGAIRYTDSSAHADSVNFYRLSAINSCNNPVTVSNIASNIVLYLGKTAVILTSDGTGTGNGMEPLPGTAFSSTPETDSWRKDQPDQMIQPLLSITGN